MHYLCEAPRHAKQTSTWYMYNRIFDNIRPDPYRLDPVRPPHPPEQAESLQRLNIFFNRPALPRSYVFSSILFADQ